MNFVVKKLQGISLILCILIYDLIRIIENTRKKVKKKMINKLIYNGIFQKLQEIVEKEMQFYKLK